MNLKNIFLASSLALFSYAASAQQTKRVLFIGNSYVASNNLPQVLRNLALSTGDTITVDSNTPGGHTFQGHTTNTTSLAKIQQGNWDYVVLQEQSQMPSFGIGQVQNQVFPFATQLNDLILASNPCAETMFYITWGRKNGDAQNCQYMPALCTYEGMDDLLRQRYMMMVEDNDAVASPVGPVWRYIRAQHPEIELYVSDESHPSAAGTYAAACTFYAAILRKDPTLITNNGGLNASTAQAIRAAAKAVAFDELETWKIGTYDPIASFAIGTQNGNQVTFVNNSENATSYLWEFGDGTTSTAENPSHTYASTGSFEVKLKVTNCGLTVETTQEVEVLTLDVATTTFGEVVVYPNPVKDVLQVRVKNLATWKLYDMLGKEIDVEGNYNDAELKLEMKQLPQGVYQLLLSDGAQSLQKVVIK